MTTTYRLVRITPAEFPSAERSLYENDPELILLDYAGQLKRVSQNALLYTRGFSAALEEFGCEAIDLYYDIEPLQKQWAHEHDLQYLPAHWREQILLAQLQHLKPDVIFFQDIHSLPDALRRNLKFVVPSARLVVTHKGFPGPVEELQGMDLLFLGIPSIERHYAAAGYRTFLLYHGFDEAIPALIAQRFPDPPEKRFDFSFTGSSGYGYGCHATRYWVLIELLKRTGIVVWNQEPVRGETKAALDTFVQVSQLLEESPQGDIDTALRARGGVPLTQQPADFQQCVAWIQQTKRQLLDGTIESHLRDRTPPPCSLNLLFPNRVRSPLFGLEMYRAMQETKVNFNIHTDAAQGEVGNMRLFQGSGIGACLLTDTGTNVRDLFEPDYEIVTYRSIEECEEKLRYLLDNDTVREEIGRRAQQRTLRHHTLRRRTELVHEVLCRHLL